MKRYWLSFIPLALLSVLCQFTACSSGSAPAPPVGDPHPAAPEAPKITAVTGEGTPDIVVSVSDVNGDPITVTATPPSGFQADQQSQVVPGGAGDAQFHFCAEDVFVGAGGKAKIEITDGQLSESPREVSVDAPPLEYADNTLYAIPLQTHVMAGEPVTILVATGTLPNPLKYMTSVRVVAPEGWKYVPNSFNVGDVGEAKDFPDGAWSGMEDDGFLMVPDIFLQGASDAGGGLVAYDFNVTPISGNDTSDAAIHDAHGALFNFQVTFNHAGSYKLGLVKNDVVPRTTYMDHNPGQDEHGVDLYWGDISNEYSGVPNTITVEPGDGTVPNPVPTEDEFGWTPATEDLLSQLKFAVEALPQSFEYGGSVDDLQIDAHKYTGPLWWYSPIPDDTQRPQRLVEVLVRARGAQNLKMLFCTLWYDGRTLALTNAAPGEALQGIVSPANMGDDFFTGKWRAITLANGIEHPQDATGLTGSGIVAKFYFTMSLPNEDNTQPIGDPPTGSYSVPAASNPPTSPDTQSTVTYDSATAKLRWGYTNPGDFNQDGSANLLDWNALLYNFGDVSDGPDSMAAVLSGEADGTASIMIITELGRHFNTGVESFNVYSGTYPDGPSTLLGSVPFGDAIGDPKTERLYFEFPLATTDAGTSYWVKPVWNGTEGLASLAYTP